MLYQTLKFLGIASLLLTPVSAQFGLGKKKKPGTTFEDLRQQAAAADTAEAHVAGEMADMAKLQEMFASSFQNEAAMKGFGQDMQKVMEELANMDPQDLQRQMQQAMEQMTSPDIMENIMGQKEAVLENLQETGMVSEEELEKFKNDPAYFESQMRNAFDQMQGMFTDPEVLKMAGETMKGMQEAFTDPAIADLMKVMESGLEDDDKIEEARLQFMQNPQIMESPIFKAMFGEGSEFTDILNDPKKWRDTIKEGMQLMAGAGAGAGGVPGAGGAGARVAGHGEL